MEDKFSIVELKSQAHHALDVARHAIVLQFPFIGEISLKMGLIPTKDSRNPTITTDGNNIYIDIDFLSHLEKSELSFAIAHEVWHCVMLHQARKQTRDKQLFDIACDMEVNHLLKINDRQKVLTPPKDALYPPDGLSDLSAEQLYDWLLEQAKEQPKDSKEERSGDQNSGQQEIAKDSISQESSNEHQEKGFFGQFDQHKYVDDEPQDGQSNSKETDGDFKPKISRDFVEQMRASVISQMQKVQLGQGRLPLGMKNFLDHLEKPEVPWQTLLAQFVKQVHSGKLEWTPPSRRHLWHDLYLQSHRSKKIEICVGIDTSGSCIEVLPKFFSELASLLKSFDAYTVYCIQCDCGVEKFTIYDSDSSPFDIQNASKMEYSGGGGSCMTPIFTEINKRSLEIDACIVLTDGYVDVMQTPPSFPTMWILTSDGNKDFCKWGKKIVLKDTKCGW